MSDDFNHPPTPRDDRPRHPPTRQLYAPPRRAAGCLMLTAMGLMTGAVAFCLLSSLLSVGNSGSGGSLSEEKLSGKGDAKVVLIELEGVIANRAGGGGLFGVGYDLVARLEREFDKAAKDEDVKAVLFEIESPGGTVTASDRIWRLVKRFREKSKKPVVIHMGGICASGGYYISVAADAIYCEPTTITGSIGVILSSLNFHELLKKHGVQDVTIKSGANKDLLNSTSAPNKEHHKILQGMVDQTHARFVDLVAQGRPFDINRARELADGRIYTAKEALAHKLVDGIGYRDDSFAAAKKLAGAAEARLVRYKRQPTLSDMLTGTVRSKRLDLELLDEIRSPRLLALWRGR